MKSIFITVAAALLLGSCGGWTEMEALDFDRPTAAERDPEGYREYLKALREYKKSEHKIVMATICGTSGEIARQNQLPMSMADSVDIICMTDAAGLNPGIVSQIEQVRNEKGTRTVCVVDYTAMDEAWKIKYDEDEQTKNDAALFAAYCAEQTRLQLSYCDAYGFDGVEVSYTGNTSTEAARKGQEAFMGCVSEWRGSHKDKLMFFRGYAHNLQDKSILADCAYVVILAGTATSNSRMTLAVQQKLSPGVPADRIVIEAAIPSVEDRVQTGPTPQAAATWVNIEYSKFTKSGLAVGNAQDDYFNPDMIYKNIRGAISIMNPRDASSPTE